MTVAIVGSGVSGAVVARCLADSGIASHVVDARPHTAGNCHTRRHATGVMEHVYGPHIFHTDSAEVWGYVNQFVTFRPYIHRVTATTASGVYSLPINLLTINQFTGRTMNPAEAAHYLRTVSVRSNDEPRTLEQYAIAHLGTALYEEFIAGYTTKQWGRHPSELPASVLKRLPLRLTYDDSYFSHRYQGMPDTGYSDLVDKILDHPLIDVSLGTPVTPDQLSGHAHVVWSGPLDAYFHFALGRLPYRTLDLHAEVHDGDFQGCAVMNHCAPDVPFTRITEYKHFTPWETHHQTVIHREFSREADVGDEPYYPVRLADEQQMLDAYVSLAQSTRGVTFVGRLGTYRYLDMDVTIAEALHTGRALAALLTDARDDIPSFFVHP